MQDGLADQDVSYAYSGRGPRGFQDFSAARVKHKAPMEFFEWFRYTHCHISNIDAQTLEEHKTCFGVMIVHSCHTIFSKWPWFKVQRVSPTGVRSVVLINSDHVSLN